MCILGQESACPPLKRVYVNVFTLPVLSKRYLSKLDSFHPADQKSICQFNSGTNVDTEMLCSSAWSSDLPPRWGLGAPGAQRTDFQDIYG